MAVTIGWRSLRAVCPNLSKQRAQELARVLGPAMLLAQATTKARAAALIAQWAHESDHFRTREEYADGSAYEGRKDLGNIRPGDGKKYKGGGFIQTTGRANYRAATRQTKALWKRIRELFPAVRHRKEPPSFEREPELVRKYDTWAAITSAIWWREHDCNALADKGDFVGLTRRINGAATVGPPSYLERRQRLHKRARRRARFLVPKDR